MTLPEILDEAASLRQECRSMRDQERRYIARINELEARAEYWMARAILELMADRHPFTSGDPDEVRRWIREVIADMKTGDFSEDLYTIAYEEMGVAP